MKRLITFVGAGVIALAMSSGAWASGGAEVTPEQIAAAHTAADHQAIAKAYEDEAANLDRKVEMHQGMADAYKSAGKPAVVAQAKHCERLAQNFKSAAMETRALAAEHRAMAKTAGM